MRLQQPFTRGLKRVSALTLSLLVVTLVYETGGATKAKAAEGGEHTKEMEGRCFNLSDSFPQKRGTAMPNKAAAGDGGGLAPVMGRVSQRLTRGLYRRSASIAEVLMSRQN